MSASLSLAATISRVALFFLLLIQCSVSIYARLSRLSSRVQLVPPHLLAPVLASQPSDLTYGLLFRREVLDSARNDKHERMSICEPLSLFALPVAGAKSNGAGQAARVSIQSKRSC